MFTYANNCVGHICVYAYVCINRAGTIDANALNVALGTTAEKAAHGRLVSLMATWAPSAIETLRAASDKTGAQTIDSKAISVEDDAFSLAIFDFSRIG